MSHRAQLSCGHCPCGHRMAPYTRRPVGRGWCPHGCLSLAHRPQASPSFHALSCAQSPARQQPSSPEQLCFLLGSTVQVLAGLQPCMFLCGPHEGLQQEREPEGHEVIKTCDGWTRSLRTVRGKVTTKVPRAPDTLGPSSSPLSAAALEPSFLRVFSRAVQAASVFSVDSGFPVEVPLTSVRSPDEAGEDAATWFGSPRFCCVALSRPRFQETGFPQAGDECFQSEGEDFRRTHDKVCVTVIYFLFKHTACFGSFGSCLVVFWVI